MQNKKGFTLIEILIVITVIAILATAALTTYVGSTKTFGFLGEYKSVIATMRKARSFAVTNKEVKGVVPQNFGISIDKDEIFIFADTGIKDFAFDPLNKQKPEESDKILETIDLKASSYTIDYKTLPTYVFYQSGTGNSAIYEKTDLVDPNLTSHITLKLTDGKDLSRYLVIFQASGLVEGFANDPK